MKGVAALSAHLHRTVELPAGPCAMLAVVRNERTKGVNSVGLGQCCESISQNERIFFAYFC